MAKVIAQQGLGALFPLEAAEARLRAGVSAGESADTLKAWLAENVAAKQRTDPDYVRLVAGIVLRHALPPKAEAAATASWDAPLAPLGKGAGAYGPLLGAAAGSSVALQVAAVFAAQDAYAAVGCPKGLGVRLLRDLLAAGAASKQALLKWQDDTTSGSGRLELLKEVTLSGLMNDLDEEESDEDDD